MESKTSFRLGYQLGYNEAVNNLKSIAASHDLSRTDAYLVSALTEELISVQRKDGEIDESE